jgi:hypothetical protein
MAQFCHRRLPMKTVRNVFFGFVSRFSSALDNEIFVVAAVIFSRAAVTQRSLISVSFSQNKARRS